MLVPFREGEVYMRLEQLQSGFFPRIASAKFNVRTLTFEELTDDPGLFDQVQGLWDQCFNSRHIHAKVLHYGHTISLATKNGYPRHVIGYAWLAVKNKRASLEEVAATISWRDEGVNKTLVYQCLSIAKELHHDSISLICSANPANGLRSLYEELGFIVTNPPPD